MTSAPAGALRSIFRDDLFRSRVCVVTGGGTGIGRCIAHEIAGLGASVVLVGRREALLAQTAQEIVEAGGDASFEVANIREEAVVEAAIGRIMERHGRIDLLVNNAGGQFGSPAASISPNGWRSVVDLNLTGTFLMSKAVHAASMATEGGSIVSIVAPVQNGFPSFAHSGAARAGVINLTKTLAVEWAPQGVRVNAVAPGAIYTTGLEQYPPAIRRQLVKRIRQTPAGRFGAESEVAAAVLFLLSPAAAFTTGETLHVDGGTQLSPLDTPSAAGKGALSAFNSFALARMPPADFGEGE